MRTEELIEGITWAVLFDGFLGVLAAGLLTILVAWFIYRSERNDRRRERLHDAVIDLHEVARDHRALEYEWESRSPEDDWDRLRDESVNKALSFRHQLRVAISLARRVDKTIAKDLLSALVHSTSGDYQQRSTGVESSERVVEITEKWLIGHNPDLKLTFSKVWPPVPPSAVQPLQGSEAEDD